MSERLLLNAKRAIFQEFYDQNKLIFNEVCFVLDQHT